MREQSASRSSWLNQLSRQRSLAELAEQTVDVVVIGGGVTGAGVALDAASRGLSVALLEAGDFASGTSQWSSKLVHGGLRYLAKMDFGVAWESAAERRLLMARNAPHLSRPLGFLIPRTAGASRIEYLLAGVGVLLADGLRRLTGLSSAVLPGPRILDRHSAHALAPALNEETLRGGILYWDGQLEDDARLVLGLLRTAAGLGAHILRDVEAKSVTESEVQAIDRQSGESITVRGRTVIMATGVWADRLDPDLRVLPSRGTHLVIRSTRLGNPRTAYTAPVPGHFGRFVFVLPQPTGVCYIGLTDVEDAESDGHKPAVPEQDVDFLLNIVGAHMSQPLTKADVIGSFAGLRPLVRAQKDSGGNSADVSRKHLLINEPGKPISIVGGKLTTYRRMAQDAVDAAVARLGYGGACRTKNLPLVGAGTPAQLRAVTAPENLRRKYGSEAPELIQLAAKQPELLEPVFPGAEVSMVELLFGVLAEGAANVDDLLERRSRLALVPTDAHQAQAAAESMLTLAAKLLAAEPSERGTDD